MHTFQSKLCFSAIANEVFYLINFQTLCVTDDGHYLPAEIGVIEYSVKRGISKKLHRFIEAGLYIHVFSFVWIAYIKLTFIYFTYSVEIFFMVWVIICVKCKNKKNKNKNKYPVWSLFVHQQMLFVMFDLMCYSKI